MLRRVRQLFGRRCIIVLVAPIAPDRILRAGRVVGDGVDVDEHRVVELAGEVLGAGAVLLLLLPIKPKAGRERDMRQRVGAVGAGQTVSTVSVGTSSGSPTQARATK